MQTVIIVVKCIYDKFQPSPSLLSCFDTGKKSTPISAGIPVLEGVGIFPESTILIMRRTRKKIRVPDGI